MIVFFNKLSHAYEAYCRPLCRELNLNQTAFDILMFLANNPSYHTARDITLYRGIKANLVSFTVEKLVREGYLDRYPVPEDRRKVGLICTEKADPIVRRGRKLQKAFTDATVKNMKETDLQTFFRYLSIIEQNIDKLNQ